MKSLIFTVSMFLSLAAFAPAHADNQQDIGMCYADVNCAGSIVGARVPVSVCRQQQAKSFYSLLTHTCRPL